MSGKGERPRAASAATGRGTVLGAPPRARAKKAWLAGRLTVKGAIHIDEGAAGALARGKSLLAAGATRVEGAFRRGDPVDIIAPDSRASARGIAEYDIQDAQKLGGLQHEPHSMNFGKKTRGDPYHL